MALCKLATLFALAGPVFSLPAFQLAKRQESPPHLLQYVQTYTNENSSSTPLSLLPLLDQHTGVTHVLLAALHINTDPNGITLNSDNPNSTMYDQIWSEAATLQQNGIQVMFMMGGAATGSYNGRLCNSNDGSLNYSYYEPLASTISYHNINGIDLDIEESVPIACPQNLVSQFKSDFGDDFIVTMAPVASDLTTANEGLSGFSYKDFDATSAGQMVDWYNTQYYSGFVQGSIEESYEGAISNGFSPARVVMGVLDASSDGSGWVSLSDLQSTIANLKSEYSDFGGADGWEYFNAGSSDGLPKPWMWTKAIGDSVFGSASKRRATWTWGRNLTRGWLGLGEKKRSAQRTLHTPPLPKDVADLMKQGYGQIEAAVAMRYAKGDVTKAKEFLREL